MNLSQILNKIVKALTTTIKSEAAAKGAAAEAEATKALGATKASKIAAGLKPYLIISAADAILGKIPVVNEIVSRIQQLKDFMVDKTVGQIPLIGKPWVEGNRLAMSMLMPNARKYVQTATPETLFNAISDSASQVFDWFKKKTGGDENGNSGSMKINNPKFYTGLDMHTAFQIPMCYPDDGGVPFAGTKDFGSIAILRLGYNPLTSYTRIKSRYTQLLDLLKGIRGLSGQLPYSEADIYFWDWNTKYLVLEYFRLKYALKLSRVYSLTKIALPKFVIREALGFDADDFIANKADYISRLTDLSNFMRNSVPMFGVISKRIEDLLYKLIPDSNDPKVALYYCTTIDMVTLIPDDTNGNYMSYYSHFRKGTALTSATTAIDLDINATPAVTYAQYNSNLDQFMQDFPYAHKAYNSLKGDLVGAFGTAVMWDDSKIGEVETVTADSMYHKFDELFLTQIQNGTILDRRGSDLRPSGVVEQATLSAAVIAGITMPTLVNGVLSDTIKPAISTIDYASIDCIFRASNPEGSAGTIIMPQSDGCGFSTTVGYASTNETSIVANKNNMSEGEALEVTQLISWFLANLATYDSGANRDQIVESYQTQVLFINKVQMLYFDNVNGALTNMRLRPTAYAIGSTQISNYTFVRETLRELQFWSQTDYGTKLPVMAYYSGSSEEFLIQDFNIMGSISKKAYETAVKYSTYSQYAADLKVTDKTGKRVNNIVDAYRAR